MSCWSCKYVLVYWIMDDSVYCAVHGETRYGDSCPDYRNSGEKDDERDKILEFIDYLFKVQFKYCSSRDTYIDELCSELGNSVKTLHRVRSLLYAVKNNFKD